MAKKKNKQNKRIQPYKKEEYKKFLEVVGKGEIPETWELLAEALGISRLTIVTWKKQPEFQKALAKGLQRSLDEMERSGKRDWRMWKERYSMLSRENKNDNPENIKRRIVAEEFFEE